MISRTGTLALSAAYDLVDMLGATLPKPLVTSRNETLDLARRTRAALAIHDAPSPVMAAINAVREGRDLDDDPQFSRAIQARLIATINPDETIDHWVEQHNTELFVSHFDDIIGVLNDAITPVTADIIDGVDQFGDDDAVFLDGRGLIGQDSAHIEAWARAGAATQVWTRLVAPQGLPMLHRLNPVSSDPGDNRTVALVYTDVPPNPYDLTDLSPWKAVAAGMTLTLADTTTLSQRLGDYSRAVESRAVRYRTQQHRQAFGT